MYFQSVFIKPDNFYINIYNKYKPAKKIHEIIAFFSV